MKLIHSSLFAVTLGLAAASAHANLNYSFDSDAQGFTTVGDGTLAHVVSGSGGYLSLTDTNGSTDLYVSVPLAAVPSDWSIYLGGSISFDATMLNGTTPTWPDFGTIRFTSMSDQVVLADLALPTEPTLTWKTYSATLDGTTFTGSGGATLSGVLANLKSVTLSMEAGNGAVEVVGLDNFRVTSAVPEPETYALMLAGLGMVATVVSRRKSTGS